MNHTLDKTLRAKLERTIKEARDIAENAALENTAVNLQTLDNNGIHAFCDCIAPMAWRFEKVTFGAAKLMEPEVQEVSLLYRILKSEKDVDVCVALLRERRVATLQQVPVVIK